MWCTNLVLDSCSDYLKQPIQNWNKLREFDCLIKTKHCDGLYKDDDTMWFLPSALNVKVKRFNQARVNGGSNYDSLKVAKCLVI